MLKLCLNENFKTVPYTSRDLTEGQDGGYLLVYTSQSSVKSVSLDITIERAV